MEEPTRRRLLADLIGRRITQDKERIKSLIACLDRCSVEDFHYLLRVSESRKPAHRRGWLLRIVESGDWKCELTHREEAARPAGDDSSIDEVWDPATTARLRAEYAKRHGDGMTK